MFGAVGMKLFNYIGVVLRWFVALVCNSPCVHLVLQRHFAGIAEVILT